MIKIGFLSAKYECNVHFEEYLKKGVTDKKKIEKDEFIDLTPFNHGSSSVIRLVYLIEKEEIYLMKVFFKKKNKRRRNILNIKHPLYSRYLGTMQYLSCNCLLIEYLE